MYKRLVKSTKINVKINYLKRVNIAFSLTALSALEFRQNKTKKTWTAACINYLMQTWEETASRAHSSLKALSWIDYNDICKIFEKQGQETQTELVNLVSLCFDILPILLRYVIMFSWLPYLWTANSHLLSYYCPKNFY